MLDDVGGGGLALDTPADPGPLTGPHDGDDLDPEATDAMGRVDFGALRVPVPSRGKVTVEPTANGRMQAVHITMPEGRLSVSALAAPKSSKLWPELSREIDASLRDGGATVRSFSGDWGRELHATSGAATSVFVGVDGARWMLYGVATGPSSQAEALDGELRRVLRGTVVMRGKSPYPVRTILPLVVPEHLAEAADAPAGEQAAGRKAGQKSGAGKSGVQKKAALEAAQKQAAEKKAAEKKAAEKKAAQKRAAQKKSAQERAAHQEFGQAEHPAEGRRSPRTAAVSGPVRELDGGTGAWRAAEADAARAAGTGADQAQAARRTAAASWRPGPAVPRSEGPPPVEPDAAGGLLPPDPPVRPADPGARRLREQGAGVQPLERREPLDEGYGAGAAPDPAVAGRRRLREDPGPVVPAADLDSGPGRRHLREPESPQVHDAAPVGRRLLGDPPAGGSTTGTGRRRLHAPEAVEGVSGTGRRSLREPDASAGDVSATGRRRLRESESGVSGTGRRALREPGSAGADVSGTGRRSLREPDASAGDVSATGRRRLRESESGVSGTGRRALREPGSAGADVSGTGRRALREPAVADTDVSATGRRHLQEPPPPSSVEATGAQQWEPAPPPASSGGRRRLRDAEPSEGQAGRRRRDPDLSTVPAVDPPAVDVPTVAAPGIDDWSPDPAGTAFPGRPVNGSRSPVEPDPVRSSWSGEPTGLGGPIEATAESAPAPAPDQWRPLDPGAGLPADGSRPGGRRRLQEPDPDASGWTTGLGRGGGGDAGWSPGNEQQWEPDGPSALDGAWNGAAADRWDPEPAAPLREPDPASLDPYAPPAWSAGLPAGGGRRRRREPDTAEPAEDLLGLRAGPDAAPSADAAPSGGRRRRRAAPEPDEDRRPDLDRGNPDRGGQRTLGSEYLIGTSEQDASWAAFLDRFGAPDAAVAPDAVAPDVAAPDVAAPDVAAPDVAMPDRAEGDGGRHATGSPEVVPPTERLRALLGDVDPARPRGRHHRES
ncbi:DUF3710 domain-containing protein [Pseudonocardia sp. MH-G8]|uniref:DUF3710 domain-containing protein n=1 Tax=Pseudonocardia sp. MH-G8 TaxID=1854588 RepID=UPI00117AD933|nr:DUF3710 domain-containing protein [Pseudonocardia sp. MH-G8]